MIKVISNLESLFCACVLHTKSNNQPNMCFCLCICVQTAYRLKTKSTTMLICTQSHEQRHEDSKSETCGFIHGPGVSTAIETLQTD
jgi:hypothetical protein